MKQKCAERAIDFIQDGMVVGLGGGRSIAYLITFIRERKLTVRIVTPSYSTALLCRDNGLCVIPLWMVDHIDVAFDGCDEVDRNFNALKSGGAIHTKEKLIGSMADHYILLVDETKLSPVLTFHKAVAIEVLPEAMSYVCKKLKEYGAAVTVRSSHAKDGMTISDSGNMIIDALFKEVKDIEQLNIQLCMTAGIVDTSLFYQIADMIIVASKEDVMVLRAS